MAKVEELKESHGFPHRDADGLKVRKLWIKLRAFQLVAVDT